MSLEELVHRMEFLVLSGALYELLVGLLSSEELQISIAIQKQRLLGLEVDKRPRIADFSTESAMSTIER